MFSALTKKVDAMSKEKNCNKVKMWQKSIKNHLYWSASGSSNGEETVAKWTSLLNHIQNVHVHENPLFPKCLHPPSTDKNKWLKSGMPLFNSSYADPVVYSHHLLCIGYSLSSSSNKGRLQAGEIANEQACSW